MRRHGYKKTRKINYYHYYGNYNISYYVRFVDSYVRIIKNNYNGIKSCVC